jgi:hypothetical protein
MSDVQGEQTFVSTVFGTVTSKRVIYNRSKGWMSGGSREDIPLKHVTSVSLEISRSILAGMRCSNVCADAASRGTLPLAL